MGITLEKIVDRFPSPLRYPGGKLKLSGCLHEEISKHFKDQQSISLVEPFAGGAAASLKLLFSNVVDNIVINDLDTAIYSFWDTAVNNTDYLISKIEKTKVNVNEWKKQKGFYIKNKEPSKELGFATLFLNRTNRSGIINGCGPIGGLKQNSKWTISVRFSKKNIIGRLEKIKLYKKRIKVKNLDGIKLLKQIERKNCSENYFIFLDPPYYKKGNSLYLNHFTDYNHNELNSFLKKTKLKWMMTYDSSSYIENLYDNSYFDVSKIDVSRFALKYYKSKEFLIFPSRFSKSVENISIF